MAIMGRERHAQFLIGFKSGQRLMAIHGLSFPDPVQHAFQRGDDDMLAYDIGRRLVMQAYAVSPFHEMSPRPISGLVKRFVIKPSIRKALRMPRTTTRSSNQGFLEGQLET